MSTTVAALRAIYSSPRKDAELQPFVDNANLLVTELLVDSGLSSARLDMISNYLAAHFAVISDRRGDSANRLGEAAETYDIGKGGTALSSTPFGQQASQLDTTGALAASLDTSGLRALFNVI